MMDTITTSSNKVLTLVAKQADITCSDISIGTIRYRRMQSSEL